MTPTDPTEAALLRAVLETPEDDVPRLVYADWLDEHADDPCPGCAFLKPGADLRQDCPDCDGSGRARGRRERAEFVRLDIERHRRWPDFARTSSWERSLSESGRELIAIESRLLDLYGADSGPCRRCDWHAPIPHGGWSWQFARGFVESVTAPLDALLPPCGNCVDDNGDQWMNLDERYGCKVCSGTGRDPGVLRALFGAQPVLTVTVVGREPWAQVAEPPLAGWWEESPQHEDNGDTLPTALMERMAGDPVRDDWGVATRFHVGADGKRDCPPGGCILFPTRAAALAALSAAFVAYGRSVAGLPLAGRVTLTTSNHVR